MSTSSSRPAQSTPVSRGISPRSLYRVVATLEMVTWALLILGMIAKYALHMGDLPVRIGGSIHGFVFLAYCVSTVLVWTDQRWPAAKGILGLVLAIVPFATLPFEKHVDAKGLLADQWRVARHGEEPAAAQERASGPAEKLLAVILRHPVLAAIVLLVFISGLFAVLLQAGPPTEWGK
ncbi:MULTISPECIES: DUF3817 domain-containing protein [Helcobacillus]|uniref:Integral membrane protein n=1 Tax=Helcobacillus massiliensis TaxID=521392 RepID=A0A839R301_9MICO|nr:MULTISPECIES: DUF3817 domain-containing protein [Helcobacillus]MBB3023646.1 integral membrane protein [Helcobacillus massiliensis]MCG7427827.1 DUF3817 domain-containing protein [Helcobacillus sp. ACRRO]MDK7741623.1 DUF3817 domain-containing protein [Helcobacillus massiliensis]WOO92667.1 DUF3817 domain-containing protein [Helcobacillus massiliensis]